MYKYSLTNIYHVIGHIESPEGWRVLVKQHIDSYVEAEWAQESKVSLQWLNVQLLKVGQTYQVWKAIPHDVRTVKRAYPNLCLLTGTYILQENRARFNQYTVRDCCLLCRAGAETHTNFIAGCSRLEPIRVKFIEQLITILSRKNPLNVISEVLLDQDKLVVLILDCSFTVVRGLLQLDENMVLDIENLSRNLCYSLHQKRSKGWTHNQQQQQQQRSYIHNWNTSDSRSISTSMAHYHFH